MNKWTRGGLFELIYSLCIQVMVFPLVFVCWSLLSVTMLLYFCFLIFIAAFSNIRFLENGLDNTPCASKNTIYCICIAWKKCFSGSWSIVSGVGMKQWILEKYIQYYASANKLFWCSENIFWKYLVLLWMYPLWTAIGRGINIFTKRSQSCTQRFCFLCHSFVLLTLFSSTRSQSFW